MLVGWAKWTFGFVVAALVAAGAYLALYIVSIPKPIRETTNHLNAWSRAPEEFSIRLSRYVKAGEDANVARAQFKEFGFDDFCTPVTPCAPGYLFYRYRVPTVFWPIVRLNTWTVEIKVDENARVINVRGMATIEGWI